MAKRINLRLASLDVIGDVFYKENKLMNVGAPGVGGASGTEAVVAAVVNFTTVGLQ